MPYLAYYSYGNAHPNLLSQAIASYLKNEVDRTLIPEQELEAFTSQVIERIAEINKTFPRCKPIMASWWKPYAGREERSHDLQLSFTGHTPCNFYLYQTR